MTKAMGKNKLFLVPMIAMLLVSSATAFDVLPATQVCSNPTSPSGPTAQVYIPPNNDVNTDGRDDTAFNYYCNTTINVPQDPNYPDFYYDILFSDPGSNVLYYSDNGSNNVIHRNHPVDSNPTTLDIVTRTDLTLPAFSSPRYFRIYDSYNT